MRSNDISILVVDDETKIVDVVKSYLEKSGYKVLEAFTGHQALQRFEDDKPSLVILDLMLPDMTGEEICKIIRSKSRVPIIMLTAKVEEEDILKGLNIGADDYITKPFSPRQLVARVRAVLRRTLDDALPLANIYSFEGGDLVVDVEKHQVKKHGKLINLTPSEFSILMALVKHPNKVYTREELITLALGEDFYGFDRTIDSHIKNLRQKIEDDPKSPKLVITVHGVGYRFGGD
ncbi:response regulator [Lutispora sp.]|jgi:DNA-binding response OmpR family regulator|uniref:response regulator n=1 Tax=Lutispora sp. TaxID=2828727 RepID=UPI0035625CC5